MAVSVAVSPAISLPSLPVLDSLPALRAALADRGCAVLAAPPGSGKTTVIPLALLDEPWLAGKKILMLEPRRVAARAAAARMASLLGEAVGETVGYQIRFERRISARTRIEVITEGLLTRRLQSDAELPGVGLVIFDEFHERSLDVDLALALTLEARASLNPELRLLVMSATLDTHRVAGLLDNAPVIESGGRLFDVELRYVTPPAGIEHGELVARACLKALDENDGDILAFLPGAREIRMAHSWLASRLQERVALRPLMGELSSADQDLALQPDRDGRRKIILATNIAQTSLTVEGVHTVVDGGLLRVARFDFGAGANRLETQRVSRASADQRAGRAGRLGPGVCYRLWSREQQGVLAAHDTAEILAVDLTGFALELAAWGITDPAQLALLDPPSAVQWQYAQERLQEVAAINALGRITAHGRALLRLPTAPRRAHMLLSAQQHGLAETAIWVAAALDARSGNSGSNLGELAARLHRGQLDAQAQRRVQETVRQLRRMLDLRDGEGFEESAIARILSWAYPERIARRRSEKRGQDFVFLSADGGEVCLHEREPLAHNQWLVIAHWEPGPPRRVRLAAVLDEAELLRDQHERLAWQDLISWNSESQSVVAESQRRLGAIVLQRKPLRSADVSETVRDCMLRGVIEFGIAALPWDEHSRSWQARVESLRYWRADEAWPDVSDAGLLAQLAEWLGPFLDGISRRDHLLRIDLMSALNSLLSRTQQQDLQRLAPTHLQVPTGSQIRLEYRPAEAPVLAVKLQEMFGCRTTPTVNGGRQAVVLHLLSPAQRPIAITQDLAGFWAGSYADVRKDLRGRYPRHPWPDNPLDALPTRRAKPRGT